MKKTPKNRQEAELITAKRQKSIEVGTEDTLQASIVRAFNEKYPEQKGRLFATFQNPLVQQYGIWIARGMVEGVSDLLYTDDQRKLIGVEIKHIEKIHKRDHVIRQANWIINNCYSGGFCVSIDMFFNIIEGRSNGIDPNYVLQHLEKYSTKGTIVFKDLLYL
jgi:hypothetical protein